MDLLKTSSLNLWGRIIRQQPWPCTIHCTQEVHLFTLTHTLLLTLSHSIHLLTLHSLSPTPPNSYCKGFKQPLSYTHSLLLIPNSTSVPCSILFHSLTSLALLLTLLTIHYSILNTRALSSPMVHLLLPKHTLVV